MSASLGSVAETLADSTVAETRAQVPSACRMHRRALSQAGAYGAPLFESAAAIVCVWDSPRRMVRLGGTRRLFLRMSR